MVVFSDNTSHISDLITKMTTWISFFIIMNCSCSKFMSIFSEVRDELRQLSSELRTLFGKMETISTQLEDVQVK